MSRVEFAWCYPRPTFVPVPHRPFVCKGSMTMKFIDSRGCVFEYLKETKEFRYLCQVILESNFKKKS